jgi:predicted membrane-bound spermidine synthase
LFTLPKISIWKKWCSYCYPVRLQRVASTTTDTLELLLYQNQFQLATADALYSDGVRYRPFEKAFSYIGKKRLQQSKSCLLLGTGIASAAQILQHHYQHSPAYTFVEWDATILAWAEAIAAYKKIQTIHSFLGDAAHFVLNTTERYDLICVDLFIGRYVPPQFTTIDFLRSTQSLLSSNGIWVMNYIVNDEEEAAAYFHNVVQVFPQYKVLSYGINRMIIAMP